MHMILAWNASKSKLPDGCRRFEKTIDPAVIGGCKAARGDPLSEKTGPG